MTGQFPLGASIRLADLSVNPYPIFERLRESEPVTWVPELGQWFVTRRDDVLKVLARSPDLYYRFAQVLVAGFVWRTHVEHRGRAAGPT